MKALVGLFAVHERLPTSAKQFDNLTRNLTKPFFTLRHLCSPPGAGGHGYGYLALPQLGMKLKY